MQDFLRAAMKATVTSTAFTNSLLAVAKSLGRLDRQTLPFGTMLEYHLLRLMVVGWHSNLNRMECFIFGSSDIRETWLEIDELNSAVIIERAA